MRRQHDAQGRAVRRQRLSAKRGERVLRVGAVGIENHHLPARRQQPLELTDRRRQICEIERVDRHDRVAAGWIERQGGDVGHAEVEPIAFGGCPDLRLIDGNRAVVDAGDMSAGAIGDVFCDAPIAAAQFQHTVVRTQVGSFQQCIHLPHVGKAMLGEVAAKHTFTKGGIRDARRRHRIVVVVEL